MSRSLLLFLSLLLPLLLAAAALGGGHGKDSDDDGERHVDMRSKSLILAKIMCLVLAFVGTFVGGVSPYLLKWNEGFLLLGTHFAVGLLLATALMRFPMDAIETFLDFTEKEYPLAFMLPIAGCLLTMLADFAISYVYGKKEEEQSSCFNGDLEVPGKWKTKPALCPCLSFPFPLLLPSFFHLLCLGSHYECVWMGQFREFKRCLQTLFQLCNVQQKTESSHCMQLGFAKTDQRP